MLITLYLAGFLTFLTYLPVIFIRNNGYYKLTNSLFVFSYSLLWPVVFPLNLGYQLLTK